VPADIVGYGRSSGGALDPQHIENLKRFGLPVHEPTAAERNAYKHATRSVADQVASKVGGGARNLLKAVRAAR
jgi:hypothetical protein